jgi:hypothetical protein
MVKENNWHLKTSPTIEILRNYLHGKHSLIQALARFHEEYQKGLPKREQKTLEQIDAPAFLERLREDLESSRPKLIFDYCRMHRACTEVLHKLDVDIGPIPFVSANRRPGGLDGWKAGSLYAYAMTNQLLRDLEAVEMAKAGTSSVDGESARRIEAASKILQRHLDGLDL